MSPKAAQHLRVRVHVTYMSTAAQHQQAALAKRKGEKEGLMVQSPAGSIQYLPSFRCLAL